MLYIALQEPWFDSYSNMHGTQYWRVIYPAKFFMKGQAHVPWVPLVNTNLSTDCYSILPLMHTDIIAICFKGENGYLSFFNVYNGITNNNPTNFFFFLDQIYCARGTLPMLHIKTEG